MHILLTVNAAWNIWNFRKPVVQSLLSQGHRVTVLAPVDDSVPDLQRLGCAFRPLAMNAKGLNPVESLSLVRTFRHVFREEKPDIVLSYTIKNNLFGAIAAKQVAVPFVPNVTGLGTAFLSGGVLEFVAQTLYRRAFRDLPEVFFQNEDDRDLFVARRLVRSDQARLLPGSGIDLDHFGPVDLPPETEPPVFLMIARLLRDKGVLEYVDAARQIRSARPETRFQLLGAVGSENRTAIDRAMVDTWVRDGTIEYLGTTADVRPFIALASCVVLPSYREGAPRTLIEAAAMARPVIATDVPGCRAVVEHEKTGMLCQVRDADSLASAISAFLALPHKGKSDMGLEGRAKMQREFNQQIVVDAYLETIRRQVPDRPL